MVYVLLGAPDSALAWYERAFTTRAETFLTLMRLPSLRQALANPGIQDIGRRMGVEPQLGLHRVLRGAYLIQNCEPSRPHQIRIAGRSRFVSSCKPD